MICNITVIRPYATQAHGHTPYIQIHNTVINWETHTRTRQNKQKNPTCTDRDTKKKLIMHLNRFDFSQLHFCVQNLFIRKSSSLFRV